MESAVLDERKALRQIMNTEPKNDGKQFEVDSAEQKCLLLHLKSNRGIFKSEESLLYAITSLIRKIVKAGEIDTSVESTMTVKLTLTSPVNEGKYHFENRLRKLYNFLKCSCLVNNI